MTTHQHNKCNMTKVVVLAVMIILWGLMHAQSVSTGDFTDTAHGNRTSGVNRSVIEGDGEPYETQIARGYCPHCHEPPGICDTPFNLFMNNYGDDKNELCYACHDTFDFGYGLGYGRYGIYQGKDIYDSSRHNTDSNMVWPGSPPGPAYIDAGNCNNCHDPHGYDDGAGFVPLLLFARDSKMGDTPDYEMGCEKCHDADGPASKDIKSALNKSHSHPTHTYNDKHSAAERGPMHGGWLGYEGHAECVDCHNPHAIGSDRSAPRTHPFGQASPARTWKGNRIYNGNFGSEVLQGVWGIDYNYTSGAYEVQSPATMEYQICFKCHGLAHEFGPGSKSAHPVMVTADSRGAALNPVFGQDMYEPWMTNIGETTMYCSDCHGHNREGSSYPKGPHGSSRKHMLASSRDNDHHYWPKNSAGTYWSLKGIVYDWYDWQGELFCRNCHTIVEDDRPTYFGNNVHRSHYGPMAGTCPTCHVTNIHGWKRSRFIAYKGDSGAHGHAVIKGFRKASAPQAYTAADCYINDPLTACGHVVNDGGYEP